MVVDCLQASGVPVFAPCGVFLSEATVMSREGPNELVFCSCMQLSLFSLQGWLFSCGRRV